MAIDVRRRITEGLLPPLTPLRDATLAADYEVSRNTTREALRMLRADGLVVHHRNRGAMVRRLDESDIRDLYVVRRVMELQAVVDSSGASEHALSRVDEAVHRAESAVREYRWSAAGTASLLFHQAVVALLGSPTIDNFFAIVLARLRLAFARMPDEPAFHQPWIPRDREIADLIRTGQRTAAANALRLYLDDSERSLIDAVRAHNADVRPSRLRAAR